MKTLKEKMNEVRKLHPGPWRVIQGPKLMWCIIDANNCHVANVWENDTTAQVIASLPELMPIEVEKTKIENHDDDWHHTTVKDRGDGW